MATTTIEMMPVQIQLEHRDYSDTVAWSERPEMTIDINDRERVRIKVRMRKDGYTYVSHGYLQLPDHVVGDA